MAPPMVMPPALVPSPARCAGEVYLCSIRYSRAGDQVVDGVLLGQLLSGRVPIFAVLAAAAHVRDGIDAAALEKRQQGGIEDRIDR